MKNNSLTIIKRTALPIVLGLLAPLLISSCSDDDNDTALPQQEEEDPDAWRVLIGEWADIDGKFVDYIRFDEDFTGSEENWYRTIDEYGDSTYIINIKKPFTFEATKDSVNLTHDFPYANWGWEKYIVIEDTLTIINSHITDDAYTGDHYIRIKE
ncbi:MAG: hypothetical protein LUI09_01720 [Prevotellaceae bacterium]|nr:hypothetical protein [Prevotellaceae bacterium]